MSETGPKKIRQRLVTETDDFGRKKFTLQAGDPQNDQPQQNPNQSLFKVGKYRSTLIGRDEKIDTNKFIGKIQTTKKNKKTQVFYCDVCKLGFKCDIAYITHVNSPAHNRKLGMNMKVLAVSKESVAQKFQRMRQQKINKVGKKEAKINKMIEKGIIKQTFNEYQQQQQQHQDEQQHIIKIENEVKLQNKCKKQVEDQVQQYQSQQEPQINEDEELMKQCLGFTSFGSKKMKH